jgi:hypothetical protein
VSAIAGEKTYLSPRGVLLQYSQQASNRFKAVQSRVNVVNESQESSGFSGQCNKAQVIHLRSVKNTTEYALLITYLVFIQYANVIKATSDSSSSILPMLLKVR